MVSFCLVWCGAGARAQDAGSAAGLAWKDARTAFAAQNYSGAVDDLTKIITISGLTVDLTNTSATIPPATPKQQWLEPVFFMMGAAQFDAKNWPGAIADFNAYRQLFPASPRMNQVLFPLAQSQLMAGHADLAVPLFTGLLPDPVYHDKALFQLIEANKTLGKQEDSIAILEREKAVPNARFDLVGRINVTLANLYFDQKQYDKVKALILEMDGDMSHVPDVIEFNQIAVRLGDQRLADQQIDEALDCYRRVRNNDQIIALQQRQIEQLQKQHEDNMALLKADPVRGATLVLENGDIDTRIAKDRQILASYQTLPPVLPPLLVRIGAAYSADGRYWEAAVVYREILLRYPLCAEAEPALYGSVTAFDRLKQTDRAQALCQSYLTQFPQGKYAETIGFLRGSLAYDSGDFAKAIDCFNDALKTPSKRREQIELILGDVKLREGKFDDAVASYAQYEKDFPQGAYREQAQYRSALALVFGGKATAADTALQAYLQQYPAGAYAPDAEYREALLKFDAKDYDGAIAAGLAWQKKNGTAAPLAEVLTMMGDSYAAQDKDDDAIAAYTHSYHVALSTDVLNYAIFAAAKLLQKHGRWSDIVTMFQDFIRDNPDHPTVVSAISWIGRSDIKLGKVDEAKKYLADTARQYLNDPTRESVDEIIAQLARLYAHRQLTDSTAAAGAAADPAAELEQSLTSPDLQGKPTAQARILFAKSELARLQRKYDVEEQALAQIAKQFKPEDISPYLLGLTGDYLLQAGQADRAIADYNYLLDNYETSSVIDYAYNGLGKIAFDQKDYAGAERSYFKALDKGLAETKLKEITLGEAQALLALNRPDEARTYFEQVASNRAWRGEATALSVFSLGEIQMQEGKPVEANAYYQRVYVAYQKFPNIQAKAYLRSGEAFEKMGKVPEAVNTYTEMVKNPNLASLPEFAVAKQRLDRLAQK